MRDRATKALMALALAGWPSLAMAQPMGAEDNSAAAISPEASQVVQWVTRSGDNRGLPFIIIDKIAAAVTVYAANGQFVGTTPALIGMALGDDTVPGIGNRELSTIRPAERTTPAGRFVARFGPAIGHHKVLWVDYPSSIALHPVVTANRKERRQQRLQSPSAGDNRVTYGCINVSAPFYAKIDNAMAGSAGSVVYILPDTKPLTEVFPAFLGPPQPAALGQ